MNEIDDFDEAWYLNRYPDVARAVRSGEIPSGYQHYIRHGKAEGRLPCSALTPEEPLTRVMPSLKPLNWPPINVETSATEDQIAAMLDRVQRNFEFMGERDPHWSVLTSDSYRADRIADTEDEFFKTGKDPVKELVATAARCGVRLGKTCFELGCGVGRSTIWLADLFDSVIGCDISAPHLRIAAETAKGLDKRNVQFIQVNRPDLIERLPPFDCFFSLIVLQHNPPPVIASYLSTVLQKLAPGGVAYFQLPTYRLGYEFSISRYLSSDGVSGMPEMHMIPQPFLYDLLGKSECLLREVREDTMTGDNQHISQRFLAIKR